MKSLTPSKTHLIYESLLSRKSLTAEEKKRHERLQKGFEGEKTLEKLFHQESYPNITAIFSNRYELDDREIQIDCTLITADMIYLLEVKNYSGNYYLENNRMHLLSSKKEINNPLSQIDRTEFLFKKLLNNLQINIPVRSFIVFVNENFILYNTPVKFPMLFRPQIEAFFQKTNKNSSAPTAYTRKIHQQLVQANNEKTTYDRRPEYHLKDCKKGILCMYCHAQLTRANRKTFTCTNCDHDFLAENIILYTVSQFHLLFPEEKMTLAKIHDWCGKQVSSSYIRTVLRKHLSTTHKSRYTHYDFKNEEIPIEILSQKYE